MTKGHVVLGLLYTKMRPDVKNYFERYANRIGPANDRRARVAAPFLNPPASALPIAGRGESGQENHGLFH